MVPGELQRQYHTIFINKDLTQHLESFLNLLSNKGNKCTGVFSCIRGKMRRLHFSKLGSNTTLKCYYILIHSGKHLASNIFFFPKMIYHAL